MRSLAVIAALAGCHHHAAMPKLGDANADITLFRDVAIVKQRVTVKLPATPTTITAKIAAGVTRVDLLERDGVDVVTTHVKGAPEPTAPAVVPDPEQAAIEAGCAQTGDCDPVPDVPAEPAPDDAAPPPVTAQPGELALDVKAPHAGTYTFVIAYTTDRLHWDADYTMTTTSARDSAVLRGAIAVRDTAGVGYEKALVRVIDAPMRVWQSRLAEATARDYVGGVAPTSPMATPREVGIATLVPGETRVEIVGLGEPHPMRSVLVYDPVGTKLDNPIAKPNLDDKLGAVTKATGVVESFEVERGDNAVGLPAGQVRLLERQRDGGLVVLGESKLFDAATRVAAVDTIAVGAADKVVGHRKRRDLTIDNVLNRAVEDFEIVIANDRDHPVNVIMREHLYRGQGWNVAFESADKADKDGVQSFSMRAQIPAKTEKKIVYSVMYSWTP
ncbi:MAG: hypothetical protein QM831_24590 [Kofleriaceae bacterium]